MPQISVIVPVYKVEPYLRRCVDSILGQTFTDFELILVDDGSPDDCGAICDKYAEQNVRIHVIHQANGGLSAARNAGIDWAFANSDSQWLAFVDSDDWVHPRYLELLYRAVETDHTKISVCDYVETDTVLPTGEPAPGTEIRDWDELFMHRNVRAVVAWNKLYARELFAGLRYPVGRIHEDEFLTYKLLIRAQKVSVLPAALYYYYQNVQGITRGQFTLRRLDCADALQERIEYVRKTGNSAATAFCVNAFVGYCQRKIVPLRLAEQIPVADRQQKERELRNRSGAVLLRYGLRYAPPWANKGMYKFAFPKLYCAAKHLVKPFRRKRREKDANN